MNKYEILDMIDEGAYGIVWKALNRQTGNLVAIKEFKDSDEDELTKKNIQRQIRMLKMLKGEFIVNIKEAFKKKNKTFLIFQYFPKNLLNYIEIYERGLDAELISKIVYKTIKCLRFLHQKNILHRDIKPENILLQTNADNLKLCDFGFARFLPQNISQLTEYVATRWYRSPELLVGEGYGKPADVWALGCIIGELVDGQPMFPGENEMDQIYLIRKNLGQITNNQISILKRNPKFFGISFPQIKTIQTIQSRYLGKIEKKALNFMKMCLTIDPEKRITVEQALNHPYLLPYSSKDNELMNDETNLLESHRKFHLRNQSKFLQEGEQKQQLTSIKTKLFTDKSSLKLGGGTSLPEDSIYKVIQHPNKLPKKNSQGNLQSLNLDKNDHRLTKKKFVHQVSPKLKAKKGSLKKLSKVMSEQKKINYNIDVKLNINLKINEKLNANKLDNSNSKTPILKQDSKLPEIKNNNSKILKYRLNNVYPGKGVNTIYNSFGNLSILGETKEINKGSKKN